MEERLVVDLRRLAGYARGPSAMKPAVFLDRDGVLNGMVMYPEFGAVDSVINPESSPSTRSPDTLCASCASWDSRWWR